MLPPREVGRTSGEVLPLPTVAPPGIGKRLRDARQVRRLSIQEAAWRTRIRPDLLRALEREQFGPLRPAVFVPGCLHSYARILGLDPGEIVRDYSARYEPAGPSPLEHLERQVRIARRPPRPKWLAAAAASALLLVIAGVAGVLGAGSDEVAATLPSLPPRLEGPAAASRSATVRVTVRILATGRTLVAVLADGRAVFEREMAPGESRTFVARSTIELVVSNAAAVRLTVNGRELGVAGPRGSVYRARFGPRGQIPE